MNWVRNITWAVLAMATLATAILPDAITLPKPHSIVTIDHATYLPGKSEVKVSLPHAIFPSVSHPNTVVRYQMDFVLPATHDKNLYLFIPSLNRRIAVTLNGEPIHEFGSSTIWVGPMINSAAMIRMPRSNILVGHNRLTVAVEVGRLVVPAYLSEIYVGTETTLAPSFNLRNFFNSQLKIMSLAAQVILGLGLIFAYFVRPKDPLFSWLAAFVGISLFLGVELFIGWQPALQNLVRLTILLSPSWGLLFVGIALALVDARPPKYLRNLIIAFPFAMALLSLSDSIAMKAVLTATAAGTVLASCIAATIIVARGAMRQNDADARLMLVPLFLMAWFATRDAYVTATVPHNGYTLLFPYPRPLFLGFLIAVFMRRMAASLDQFDRANETLANKLTEREAELAALYRQEHIEASRRVREHERQRLTHDLHDGISGHLVSIIALSERTGEKPIELAAREALNDLRLVIYSLDLGDRELPIALANFRDRLIPQLQRLGVQLDWSIARLPEVSGVTPGNALAILRILQEATTNAIKHGPARRIKIYGAAAEGGAVAIVVENDGRPFAETNSGHGLANMRLRTQRLHGKLNIESMEGGVRLTLLFPSSLPDFEDEPAARF